MTGHPTNTAPVEEAMEGLIAAGVIVVVYILAAVGGWIGGAL